ncbi:glycosyltransferase family 2 protein [Gramella lutea]|uniref:Glycosyltransferase family 2 protein n=1 Tax=Christiangramia lutea TaxID=1607951 RepID=A0A9X1V2S9_9FLAO|nr:glycosyltransferase family 2 protein [Christiangramia lutea]MCH4822770.1 glycosyltransferase family 2 protein [Christiangramia lutea]
MISVIILTKNEEEDIARCLDSLSWTDDVHVLDSGSDDRTVKIAESFNVKVSRHPFESFGKQRNYALDKLELKYDWILFLDADEVITPEFRKEILKSTSDADENTAGYYCCWKMMLEGRWLKYCDNFPKWQFRLLKKGRARFTDFGHGQKEDKIDGELGYIKNPYLHYSFSKGWTEWIDRHNRYSVQEAEARLYRRPDFRDIFNRHSSVRNPALKSWLIRMPGWPFLRFLHAYFFNLGFLEGTPGFIYCVNMAYHEFLISIKMRELKRKKHQMEVESINTI